MSDYEAWKLGAVQYPLTEETTNPLRKDADPALHYLTGLLTFALETELLPRLRAEGEALRERLVFDKAVATVFNIEPIPRIYTESTKFPVLALYRKTDVFAKHSTTWNKGTSELEVAYILPALLPREQDRIQPILRAVTSVIANACWRGRHPRYENGLDLTALAQVQSCRLIGASYEPYAKLSDEERFYRAMTGRIEVVEREQYPVGVFEPFTGVDASIDHRAGDGTTIADVVVFETHQPPTITNVIPNAGTKAGGTAVTIVGTNFRTPAKVVFDTTEVDAVVVNPTTITAVTPAHEAYPTFMSDVIVKNGDGQQGRAPAAFSFTTP